MLGMAGGQVVWGCNCNVEVPGSYPGSSPRRKTFLKIISLSLVVLLHVHWFGPCPGVCAARHPDCEAARDHSLPNTVVCTPYVRYNARTGRVQQQQHRHQRVVTAMLSAIGKVQAPR